MTSRDASLSGSNLFVSNESDAGDIVLNQRNQHSNVVNVPLANNPYGDIGALSSEEDTASMDSYLNNLNDLELESNKNEYNHTSNESDNSEDRDLILQDIESSNKLRDDFLFERKNGLLICQWNVDGFTNNIRTHLHYIICTKCPDIFVLQEMYKFYDKNCSDWNAVIKGYKSIKMKKDGYGKVLVLIRNGIHHERININFKHNNVIDKRIESLNEFDSDFEAKRTNLLMTKLYTITLKVYNNNMAQAFIINTYYRPQNGSPQGSDINLILKYYELLVKKPAIKNHPVWTGGDFNAHNNAWFNGEIRSSKAQKCGDILSDWIYKNKWNVLNDGEPTRIRKKQRTAPDVVITNSRTKDDDWKCWSEDLSDFDEKRYLSDHVCLYSYHSGSDLYEVCPDEFVIKMGEDRNWDKWEKELAIKVAEWNGKYGDKINKLIDHYLEVYGNGNCDINRRYLMDHVGLSEDDIIEAVEVYFKRVIIDTSINALGLRKKSKGKSMPWMTMEIKNAISGFKSYKQRFESFSKKKKRKCKGILNAKRAIRNELCENGKIAWLRDEIRSMGNEGRMPWKKINAIIKNDKAASDMIPVWYNRDGTINAIKSSEKAANYLNYIHRFDDDEMEEEVEKVENRKFDKIVNDYNQSNRKKFGTKLHREETIKMNSIMRRDETKKIIMSFSRKKAGNSDKSNYVLLQNGIDILGEGLYRCYNILFILGIRVKFMNVREISLILKAGKEAKYMDSYRPVALLSSCSNPFDKWMAGRYLTYGIKMRIIRLRHFGFIKGVGCNDTIAYLVELIWNNRIIRRETHVILIDFKAAFDTLQHKMILDCMEFEIGVTGFALRYLYVALEYRWGRVKVYGFYSEWRQDVCGVPQGWPPSSVIFIFFSIEFDVVNELNLGLTLIGYADDNNLVSDGSVHGKKLEENMQFAVDLICYIAKKKRLFLQPKKQNYIVIDDRLNKKKHEKMYYNITMDGKEITKKYSPVKYLGVWIDWNLNWDHQYATTISNARRAFINIYNRYKYASDMLAKYLVNIYKAFVFPKILYAAEIWYSDKHPLTQKLRALYNDMIRHCNGTNRSNPITWQHVQIGESDLAQTVKQKKSTFWSRLLRSPTSNVLSQIIKDKYWTAWSAERVIDDTFSSKARESQMNDSKPQNDLDIVINNKIRRNGMNKEWTFKENKRHVHGYKDKKTSPNKYRMRFKGRYHILYEIFDEAKNAKNSDYIFMKDIDFGLIPKRISHQNDFIPIPRNLTYQSSRNDAEKLSFSKKWVRQWADTLFCHDGDPQNIYKVEDKNIQLLFSDGSNKDMFGGAGYWSCNLKYYLEEADLDELRRTNYVSMNRNSSNGVSDYCYGAYHTGIRSSIDHCELDAAIHGISDLYRYCYDIFNVNEKDVPGYVCIAIDSETVVKWLAGEWHSNDPLICDKIRRFYEAVSDLADFNIDVNIIWVKAHNNEIGNEAADDMAKAAMYDIYQTRNWNEVEKIYSNTEWINYGMKAVKKENKRYGLYNTLNKWSKYRERRGSSGDSGDALTKNLIDWEIGYHYAYKYELNNLYRWQWCIITQLRCGHNCLNAQRKYGIETKMCAHNACINEEENLKHFIWNCPQYEPYRSNMVEAMSDLYQVAHDMSFMDSDYNNLIKFMLFPYQLELSEDDIKNDKQKRISLLDKRIEILKHLCDYVKQTKRFESESMTQ